MCGSSGKFAHVCGRSGLRLPSKGREVWNWRQEKLKADLKMKNKTLRWTYTRSRRERPCWSVSPAAGLLWSGTRRGTSERRGFSPAKASPAWLGSATLSAWLPTRRESSAEKNGLKKCNLNCVNCNKLKNMFLLCKVWVYLKSSLKLSFILI